MKSSKDTPKSSEPEPEQMQPSSLVAFLAVHNEAYIVKAINHHAGFSRETAERDMRDFLEGHTGYTVHALMRLGDGRLELRRTALGL